LAGATFFPATVGMIEGFALRRQDIAWASALLRKKSPQPAMSIEGIGGDPEGLEQLVWSLPREIGGLLRLYSICFRVRIT
jgi:hypothetical protein